MDKDKATQPKTVTASQPVECLKLKDGLFSRVKVGVVIEKELPIYINGHHLVTASITPGMEREFITGYLFGQGFINSAEELESVNIVDNTGQVAARDAAKISDKAKKAGYRVVSGCGKTAFSGDPDYPKIHSDLQINKQTVFTAMKILFDKAEIYEDTEGVHSAGLFTAEAAPICIVEDIGRHNCLDKLTGYALMNDVDCSHCFLVSTGRMASEMAAKICRAGIPIAATKTAVTDKGLEIGRKCGMTVIGFVRDAGTRINTNMETRTFSEAGMKIYTSAERIENR